MLHVREEVLTQFYILVVGTEDVFDENDNT